MESVYLKKKDVMSFCIREYKPFIYYLLRGNKISLIEQDY
jgi:hypothetical protein